MTDAGACRNCSGACCDLRASPVNVAGRWFAVPKGMWTRTLLLGTSVLFAACAGKAAHEPPQQAQLTRAVTPPHRLEAPDYMPGTARTVLKTMMAAHARNMGDL